MGGVILVFRQVGVLFANTSRSLDTVDSYRFVSLGHACLSSFQDAHDVHQPRTTEQSLRERANAYQGSVRNRECPTTPFPTLASCGCILSFSKRNTLTGLKTRGQRHTRLPSSG